MFIFYIALFVWPFLAPGVWWLLVVEVILALVVGEYHKDRYPKEFGTIGWFFSAFVFYCFVVVLFLLPYDEPVMEEKTVLSEKVNIVSLHSQAEVHGTFRLGYGFVGTSPAYQVMRQKSDGGYIAFIITGDITLYEDAVDVSQARVETFTRYRRESRVNVPSWIIYVAKEDRYSDWEPYENFSTIHVPEGTVLTEFKS